MRTDCPYTHILRFQTFLIRSYEADRPRRFLVLMLAAIQVGVGRAARRWRALSVKEISDARPQAEVHIDVSRRDGSPRVDGPAQPTCRGRRSRDQSLAPRRSRRDRTPVVHRPAASAAPAQQGKWYAVFAVEADFAEPFGTGNVGVDLRLNSLDRDQLRRDHPSSALRPPTAEG